MNSKRTNYLLRTTRTASAVLVTLLFITTTLITGCGRVKELDVPMKYPLVKAYDTYLEGELLGWCDYQHPIIPVLYNDRKIIFCKESALQNIAATVEIEGELLSCRLSHGERKKKEYLMTIITRNDSDHKLITAYKITNLSEQEGGVDLEIEQLFNHETKYEKILFYNSFYQGTDEEYKYPHIICYSKDRLELGMYSITGNLISTRVLDKYTVFIENADAQYGFYGFDGKKVMSFHVIEDKIDPQKTLTLDKEYDVSNFVWTRGRYSHENNSITPIVLVLNIDEDLYFINSREMSLMNKDNIQFDDNIGQLIYSKKGDGLYFVARDVNREIFTKTYKKFLNGDFDLWVHNFTIFAGSRYFISIRHENQMEGALILELIGFDELCIKVAAFEPLFQSKIKLILADRGYLKDFSIITEDGVYKLDLKSGAYGEYEEDMIPEFTKFQKIQ